MHSILKYFFYTLPILLGSSLLNASTSFPLPLESYQDSHIHNLIDLLKHRIAIEPFNAVATLIFFLAIIHTFLAGHFRHWAHILEEQYHKSLRAKQYEGHSVCFKSQLLHFLGEVEAIFGIWILPLVIAIIYFHGLGAVVHYLDSFVEYNEPIFVVIIMTIASTRPVLYFAQNCMRQFARLGNLTPRAWWFSIMTIGSILGSFITEPAAMTIAALLLGSHFYYLEPTNRFKYATLGLLFVNISIGGTLSHFAAPPVLMVAKTWGWDLLFMLDHFAWKSCIAILLNTTLVAYLFRNEFKTLQQKASSSQPTQEKLSIPLWVTCIHLFFLAFTVLCLHHTVLYVGGFLFFLAFTQATVQYQYNLSLRSPLLVGFFLAGLVTHGNLQQWWIAPLLSRLGESSLFIVATVLTSFNDNAAITYLASLVPAFKNDINLQVAVVEGAVAGGGLTVIANAPNPAGQSILSKFFGKEGVSPVQLFLWALLPTIIVCCIYRCFPT